MRQPLYLFIECDGIYDKRFAWLLKSQKLVSCKAHLHESRQFIYSQNDVLWTALMYLSYFIRYINVMGLFSGIRPAKYAYLSVF